MDDTPATGKTSLSPENKSDPKTADPDWQKEAAAIYRRLGPVGPLAIVAASLPAVGGIVLLWQTPDLGPWLHDHGLSGLLLYVAAFSLLAGLAILPTYAQAFLAGKAFALAGGSVGALSGLLGAASVGYLIARRASGDRAVRIIEEHPKWQAVYDALLRSGHRKSLLIVTLLRVAPNSPFAITNLVLAATRVPLPVFLGGTLLGMAPRTVAAVLIGANWPEGDNPLKKWLFYGGIVVTLIVFGIIGAIAKQALAKITNNNSPANNGPAPAESAPDPSAD